MFTSPERKKNDSLGLREVALRKCVFTDLAWLLAGYFLSLISLSQSLWLKFGFVCAIAIESGLRSGFEIRVWAFNVFLSGAWTA